MIRIATKRTHKPKQALKNAKWKNVWAKGEYVDMGVLHNLKIEPSEIRVQCARVAIDDKPIKCCGYSINHRIDEVPTVKLELCCIPSYEHEVFVQVSNKEEIARLMDKAEFEEFCNIWKEVHNG